MNEDRRTLRRGRLGSWDGLGLVTVARAADGTAYDANGTWRPDDPTTDVAALRDAFRAGAHVRYEGAVLDPADTAGDARSFEVVVTGVNAYEDHEGRSVYLVNFDVPGIA